MTLVSQHPPIRDELSCIIAGDPRIKNDDWKMMLALSGIITLLIEQNVTIRYQGCKGVSNVCVHHTPHTHRQIFIPYDGYNGYRHGTATTKMVKSERAKRIGKFYLRSTDIYRGMNQAKKDMMARDVHMVLGEHLDDPVSFVIWIGQTSLPNSHMFAKQPVVLADKLGIEIITLPANPTSDYMAQLRRMQTTINKEKFTHYKEEEISWLST